MRKISVRDLSTLGLLLGITVLLAIFGTFRIGEIVKIPTKFISVFVAGALFGPFWGGASGALGDLINATLLPVGPILPQITAIEFLSGFTYGAFFSRGGYSKVQFALRVVLCVLIQFFIDMVLTTLVLALWVGYYPSFHIAFITRLPAGLFKAALQLALILPARKLIERMRTAYGRQ